MADIVGMVLAQQFDTNAVANRMYVGALVEEKKQDLMVKQQATIEKIKLALRDLTDKDDPKIAEAYHKMLERLQSGSSI